MDISLLQALSRGQVDALFNGVRDAFDEHVRWACRCQNALLSAGEADEGLLVSDAHRKCNFGAWYYGPLPEELRRSSEFVRLGELHRQFHEAASNALKARASGRKVGRLECENLLQAQSELLLSLNGYLCDVAGGGSLIDPLTGVLNREEMVKLLRREQSRVMRTGNPCTLVLADLDHFKRVNDTFGHDAGDLVLRAAVGCFSSVMRPYDLLFRYGGEEFLFCLPDTNTTEAAAISERMRDNLSNLAVEVGQNRLVRITASMGVAPLLPGFDVGRCINEADKALYSAKEGGRNRVRASSLHTYSSDASA